MKDILDELAAVSRRVEGERTPAGESRSVVLRRRYAAEIDDVWDAITDPERLKRWFVPVSGDLRLGGKYQIEGNAGGEILRCEPPRLLAVTWVYGDDAPSEVGVRLSPVADGTDFELVHSAVVAPERWSEYGPGATGVGWDLALLGLGLHLAGEVIEDPAAWESTPEAKEFSRRSSAAWGAAMEAGGATPEEAARAAENTTRFYVPE
jgi:uncharacterized protein YndB with AHSA1/START domain